MRRYSGRKGDGIPLVLTPGLVDLLKSAVVLRQPTFEIADGMGRSLRGVHLLSEGCRGRPIPGRQSFSSLFSVPEGAESVLR